MLPICQLAGILTASGGGGVAPDVDPLNILALFQQPFAEDAPWRLYPVSPVLGDTAFVVDNGTNTKPYLEQGEYSSGCFLAHATDSPMVVHDRGSGTLGDSYVGGGIQIPESTDQPLTYTIPHWPADTFALGGLDQHICIINPSLGRIYNLYHATIVDGVCYADIITWTPIGGRGWGDATHWQQGARAGMSPAVAGMIRLHEIAAGTAGTFDHPLSMGLSAASLSGSIGHIFPGCKNDPADDNHGSLMEGALVMLPSDFDAVGISSNPWVQKVARTLKKQGAYITDRISGPQFVIYAEVTLVEADRMGIGFGQDQDDMKVIADALRPVVSVSGWKRIVDDVNIGDMPSAFNLMSMKGSWDNGAEYDTYNQRVTLPADAGTYTSYDGSSIRQVDWAGPTYIEESTLTWHAKGSEQGKIQILDGGGNVLRDTGFLSNGDSTTLVVSNVEQIKKMISKGVGAGWGWFDLRATAKPAVSTITIEDGAADTLVMTTGAWLWGALPDPSVFTLSGGKTATRVWREWPVNGGAAVTKIQADSAYIASDTVTLGYTKSGTFDLHSAHGSKMDNFAAHAVTNNLSVDTTAPSLTWAISEANPDRLVATASEPLSGTLAAAAAFAAGTTARTVLSRTSVSSTSFYLTMSSRYYLGETETVDYTKPGSNPIKDASNNETDTTLGMAVTNNTTTPQEFKIRLGGLSAGGNTVVETGDGTAGWNYHGVAGGDEGNTLGVSIKGIPDGEDGYLILELDGTTWNASHGVAFYFGNTIGSYWLITALATIQGGGSTGGSASTGVAPAAGFRLKIAVEAGATQVSLYYAIDSSETWIQIGSPRAYGGGHAVVAQIGFYDVNGTLNLRGGNFV